MVVFDVWGPELFCIKMVHFFSPLLAIWLWLFMQQPCHDSLTSVQEVLMNYSIPVPLNGYEDLLGINSWFWVWSKFLVQKKPRFWLSYRNIFFYQHNEENGYFFKKETSKLQQTINNADHQSYHRVLTFVFSSWLP